MQEQQKQIEELSFSNIEFVKQEIVIQHQQQIEDLKQ